MFFEIETETETAKTKSKFLLPFNSNSFLPLFIIGIKEYIYQMYISKNVFSKFQININIFSQKYFLIYIYILNCNSDNNSKLFLLSKFD